MTAQGRPSWGPRPRSDKKMRWSLWWHRHRVKWKSPDFLWYSPQKYHMTCSSSQFEVIKGKTKSSHEDFLRISACECPRERPATLSLSILTMLKFSFSSWWSYLRQLHCKLWFICLTDWPHCTIQCLKNTLQSMEILLQTNIIKG